MQRQLDSGLYPLTGAVNRPQAKRSRVERGLLGDKTERRGKMDCRTKRLLK